jgi:hypothetical protein
MSLQKQPLGNHFSKRSSCVRRLWIKSRRYNCRIILTQEFTYVFDSGPSLCEDGLDGPICGTQGTLLGCSWHSRCLCVCFKAFLAQIYRDESIGRLVDTINDTYEFVHEVEPLKKVDSHREIIVHIMQQTTECGYFIRDYYKNKDFCKFFRILKCDDF